MNTISNGELSDPLCDSVNRGPFHNFEVFIRYMKIFDGMTQKNCPAVQSMNSHDAFTSAHLYSIL